MFGFFKALWLGFIHLAQVIFNNCKNIEDYTKTNHGIDYMPFQELIEPMLKTIKDKKENPINELVEGMGNQTSKAFAKAMLNAVKNFYSMRNKIII